MTFDVRTLARATALISAAIGLAGCFGPGEPSANDIRDAIGGEPQATRLLINERMIVKPTEMAEFRKMVSIDKASCAPAVGAPGFVCDFRIGVAFGGEITYLPSVNARFFKSNEGWRIAADENLHKQIHYQRSVGQRF